VLPALAVTGAAGVETWTLLASSVAFHLQPNPSPEDVYAEGRIERQIIFTLDLAHFDEQQDVDADYIIKIVSLNRDGLPTENYGRFFRLRSQPRSFAKRARRNSGKKSFLMNALPRNDVPEGVS
jgi:hypothetical protein